MAQGRDRKGNPLETPIQASILDNLIHRGVLAWRNQKGIIPIRRGRAIIGQRKSDPRTNGMPDIIAVIGGRFIGIEVKSAKGVQDVNQKRWQGDIERAGGVYILARRWEDVAMMLLEYGIPI